MAKEGKTAIKKGARGRVALCPTHGTPLEPALLVPPQGRPRDGYQCHAGGRPQYPLMPCPTTHYYTREMEVWP